MASPSRPNLLFFLIWATLVLQGVAGFRTLPLLPHQNSELHLQVKKFPMRKRTMIGSVKPTCTYNECRGCRSRCRAEQVPVEGNDPINREEKELETANMHMESGPKRVT
ncbi:hypothetical protein LXL04_036722 [Taraxacum kok-saghyz]